MHAWQCILILMINCYSQEVLQVTRRHFINFSSLNIAKNAKYFIHAEDQNTLMH